MLRTLFRPVGPAELKLIASSGFSAFPPRLPEQPIFYPVLNEEYAREIAQRWNVPESGSGYVTRFAVDEVFVSQFPMQTVGAHRHQELWVPADKLDEFNKHIVGKIEVIATFTSEGQ
ncbi:MAG: ADP-ribosylation/crystallin J1 [Myxococcaceae bacterium]|nr:ADP-ribosylation/crystallin J1 [Myxococcaceae bacterium]